MQMLTRDMVLMGPPRSVSSWSTTVAERFTSVTGKQVETWQSLVGGHAGHVTWSMAVEGAAELLELSGRAMADDEYAAMIEAGRELFTGPARDTLYRALTPVPDGGTRPGNALMVTVATPKAGKLGDAIGWGVEAAQHVEGLIGRPTMLAMPTVGPFSQLVWMTASRDVAEADANLARTNGDDGYQKLVARGGDLFVDGSGHQEMFVRIG